MIPFYSIEKAQKALEQITEIINERNPNLQKELNEIILLLNKDWNAKIFDEFKFDLRMSPELLVEFQSLDIQELLNHLTSGQT